MATERVHKRDAARQQLKTAIDLFLSGFDRSSVITLAGAASAILHHLVEVEGKKPFLDTAIAVYHERIGEMPKRVSYRYQIDKKLGVTPHKHFGKGDPEAVELDLDKMAADAIIRSVSDYITLAGQDEAFVRAFLQWTWANMDGPGTMERFRKIHPKTQS